MFDTSLYAQALEVSTPVLEAGVYDVSVKLAVTSAEQYTWKLSRQFEIYNGNTHSAGTK